MRPESDLEGAAIGFPQGALVQFTALEETVIFPVVGGKVFQRGADTFALDAPDIGCGEFAGQHAVLGKIFEIAAA